MAGYMQVDVAIQCRGACGQAATHWLQGHIRCGLALACNRAHKTQPSGKQPFHQRCTLPVAQHAMLYKPGNYLLHAKPVSLKQCCRLGLLTVVQVHIIKGDSLALCRCLAVHDDVEMSGVRSHALSCRRGQDTCTHAFCTCTHVLQEDGHKVKWELHQHPTHFQASHSSEGAKAAGHSYVSGV